MDKPVRKLAVENDEGFPTVAIVVIAVGGYMLIFIVILIIRKICISKGNDICPSWCAELCICNSCRCIDDEPSRCTVFCAESCDCPYPNKRSCMDAVCPSKEWCDEVCCCCFSQEPEGKCLCCNWNDGCCDFGETCGCSGCKEYCQSCKCECCAQPETIDCCCIEIKLAGATQRAMANSMNNGYNNQGYMNQGVIGQQPQYGQPGFSQQSGYNQQPGFHQQPGPAYGNQSAYNQQQMFSGQSHQPSINQQAAPRSAQNMFSAQVPSTSQPGNYPLEQVTTQWTRPGSNVGS